MFAHQAGLRSILKSGGQYLYNEEAIASNIEACTTISACFRSCYGPNSMKKLLVNHIDKIFVSSDVATLVQQYEIQHPGANLLGMAAKMQEQECGDGTNYTILFAGELLTHAGLLMKTGYHIADIVQGYQEALKIVDQSFKELVCYELENIRCHETVAKAIASSIAPKAVGYELNLASLVADALLEIMPANPMDLNIDNFRVCKIVGNGLFESYVVRGMVISRKVSSICKEKQSCKVMVLGCGLELSSTETKGTVLINTANQLINYAKGEEEEMENIIKSIVNTGVQAIIVGGNVSDLGQHYCNKYDLLVLKCQSKYELRRLCRTLGATSLIRLTAPTPEEIGHAKSIITKEIASTIATIIEAENSKVSTIVLRGATLHLLDEFERAIMDGARCVKNVTKDKKFLPGGGAAEVQLSLKIHAHAWTKQSVSTEAMIRFAEALEKIPYVIAENSGYNGTLVLAQLKDAYRNKTKDYGVDIESSKGHTITDMLSAESGYPVLDHFKTKENAIKLAVDAATTALMINALCVARPAGGPKPPEKNANWDED